jgi:hypothetical protein
MFITIIGCAELKQCARHGWVANCYKCLVCNLWFCENCDFVHPCHGCGGTYCVHCKPCRGCANNRAEGIAVQPHANALICECGGYLNLAGGGCEECRRLDCLGSCERQIRTNPCCSKDKCWRCSLWHVKKPELQIRVCRTCPLTSGAVLHEPIAQ